MNIKSNTFWIGTSWKMNKIRHEVVHYCETLKRAHTPDSDLIQPFVIPPFPYIQAVSDILAGSRVKVGAQNMHWDDQGAWTGEISAPMLLDVGASIVELGHSERRTYFNETDETVALKVQAALKHELLALVCIGDTKEEFDSGLTANALSRQVKHAIEPVKDRCHNNVILAYEPVWSIGEGGIPADPEFANSQHELIKEVCTSVTGAPLPVLYGGSVNIDNACDFAGQDFIDGLFIGRSAWDVQDYITILNSVFAMRNDH